MKKIIILAILCLVLCGCENKKCIKSHEEKGYCIRPQCVFMGINQIYSCTKTICDEYENEVDE